MAEKTTTKRAPGRKKTLSVVMNNGVPISKDTGEIVDIKAVTPTHEVRIVDTNEDNLATGIAINTYDKTSLDYLKDLREFTTKTDDVKKQIDLCNKLYKIDGTVSTALDVLIDFTISEYAFKTEEKYEDLFNFYGKSINKEVKTSDTGLRPLLQELALEWFLSGNAFPYSTWKKTTFENNEYFLPTEIQLLNPNDIYIPELLFSQRKPVYVYRPFFSSDKSRTLRELQVLMESDSLNKVQNQLKDKKDQILANDRIYHLKRRARSYDIWGIPYLVKTFNVVASKMKLRALDNSTTEGMIHYLTIFKVGSPDKDSPYHVVPASRLNALAGLIRYPQASTTMVWAHDIEVITSGPDGEILNFENKYDEVNAELVKALGVPQILLDGKGTATASWVAILSLVERLERVRESLKEYIDYLFSQIVERNKLKSEAEFTWFPINLRDEKMVKTLLMSFYDKGLLPIKTTLKEGGYNPSAIIEEMKLEKENDELEDLFKRRDIPFSPAPEDVEPKKEPEEPGRPKEKMEASDTKYQENLFTIYNEFRDELKKKPEIVDSGLQLMHRRLEQVFETYTDSVIDKEDIFSIKVIVWNGKYLDKLVANLQSEIGNKPDKFRIEGVFSEFEKRFTLFSSESLKNINLAVTLKEQKELGKKGAIIKVSKDTKCSSCKSYEGNFYTLEELFSRMPIHPNSGFQLEFKDTNLIETGEVINTPIVIHHKNLSKTL